jgi:hypothetical protein
MGNKFIIYADESGNQSLKSVEPEYPVFVLAFCVFDIDDYIYKVVPAFQKLNSQLERLGWQGRAKYASKLSISTGLQIADLVARPIGMNLISPNAGNRPFEVIEGKLLA